MKQLFRAMVVLMLVSVVMTAAVTAKVQLPRDRTSPYRMDQRQYTACVKDCNAAFSKASNACAGIGAALLRHTMMPDSQAARPYVTSARCRSDATRRMYDCKKACKSTLG